MEELNHRNTETVEQVIKEQNSKLFEQQKTISLLSLAVSNLTEKVTELEKMVMLQKIQLTGTGPSK